MRLMHGLLAPSAGACAGTSPTLQRAPAQAMVFQRPVMLRRSAIANVIYALELAGVPPEREAQALAALEEVGLRTLAHRPARVLSGASSSGSRWRAPGRCIPRCCSWMSRPRASIPARRARSRP